MNAKTKQHTDEVIRPLVLPTLKYAVEEPIRIKIETKMVESKMSERARVETDKKAPAGKKMDPATICQVINLDTGERQTLICNSVLVSTLEEAYPGDKYVGLCFRVVKHAKATGKRYHTFSIDQIKEPK